MKSKLHLAFFGLCLTVLAASAEAPTLGGVCTGLNMEECARLSAPVIWNNARPIGGEAGSERNQPVSACEATCDKRYYDAFAMCRTGLEATGDFADFATSSFDICFAASEPRYQQCRMECGSD